MYSLFIPVLFAIFISGNVVDYTNKSSCYPRYYVEYGEEALLRCNFPMRFVIVQWYAASDNRPTITLKTNIVSGPGHESRKLDITSEGWLRITDINFGDEGYYTVVVGYSDMRQYLEEETQVIVFIRPHPSFPMVEECGNKNSCLVSVTEASTFQCSVRTAKPLVALTWHQKEDGKDKRLQADRSFSSKTGKTFSSFSDVNVKVPRLLKVISCQSYSPFPILQFNETIVLLENTNTEYPWNEGEPVYQYLHADVLLNCKNRNPYYVLWKARSPGDGKYTAVGYIAYGKSEVFRSNAQILKNGSLILKNFHIPDEGEYICIGTSNNEKNVKVVYVKVFIPPLPPFPQIIGCDSGPSQCTRVVERQDYLTCHVYGIRPPVHLDFKYAGEGPSPIKFSNLVPSVDENDEVYNIRIRENFEILVEESINIPVECIASGPNVDKFKSKARITLSYHLSTATGGFKQHFVSGTLIVLIFANALVELRSFFDL